jgi:hypothetical protein
MILTNLDDHNSGDSRTISMDLVWEDNDRSPQTLYFSADGETAQLMRPGADAFAIACLPSAAWLGERRMRVDGQLCTRLRAGLKGLNQIFADWFPNVGMVSVEPAAGFVPTRPPAQRRLASLLSGGVDGLASLRQNRLDYPLDHPESIRACITLFGINTYDVDENGPVRERLEAFDALLARLQTLAEAEHFDLHPVRTNVRSLAPDYKAWTSVGFGAGHIAVSQLFQGSFDKVLFASDGEGPNPAPGPMHPVITAWFSTNAVTVQGDQDEMLRSEKVALLADWEHGRRLMQPCHYVRIPENGKINCGQCEKCVRTMLALIGLGRLDEVSAFTDKHVTPGMIKAIPMQNTRKATLLLQSLPLLEAAGRNDLARAVRIRVWKFRLKGR